MQDLKLYLKIPNPRSMELIISLGTSRIIGTYIEVISCFNYK